MWKKNSDVNGLQPWLHIIFSKRLSFDWGDGCTMHITVMELFDIPSPMAHLLNLKQQFT